MQKATLAIERMTRDVTKPTFGPLKPIAVEHPLPIPCDEKLDGGEDPGLDAYLTSKGSLILMFLMGVFFISRKRAPRALWLKV